MLYTVIGLGVVALVLGLLALVRRPHNKESGDHVAQHVLTRINAEYQEHRH